MKRIIIKLLIFVLTFSSISYVVFHQDEEHNHLYVHTYEIEALTVNCPYCGQPMELETFGEQTCTQGAHYWAYCHNESCPEYDPIAGDGYQTEGDAPALGHDYNAIIEAEPTCTEGGVTRYTCSRCGDTYRSYPEALGHNYKSKVTKEATCTEDGVRTYTCTRTGCNSKYTRKIEKLGHDIELEEKEATCTEDGYKKGKCSRCDETIDEVYPALGHDMNYTITKNPMCTDDGEREGVCSRCGEKVNEKILAFGHKYPAEWTREKEPSYTEEGLESKTCYYCGNKITQPIPKLDATPIIVGGGAATAAAGGGLLLYLKKLRAAKFAKQAIKGIRKFEKPSFEDRSVMVSSKFEDLMTVLKEKSFLEVTSCEDEEIEESIEEAGPDLLIVDVLSEERLEELLSQKEEALADYTVGVVTTDEFIADHKEQFDQLVKDKKILNYIPYGSDANKIMLKLIAPILKPDIKSDESLGNIGAVADFIGIPAVSTLIDVYVSGRDIKSTLESDEIGMSEAATIIGDLASILGYDGVASVAGLVDDVDSVKAALDKEAGAYEGKNAISGAKDIVEVVSDIIDKD